MKKKIIKIAEVCGEDIVSRDDGLKFREYVVRELNKYDKLIFDFENLTIASVSFIDEAFAKLNNELPEDYVYRYVGEIRYDEEKEKYHINVGLKKVHIILKKAKVNRVPIVDADGKLTGLVCLKDILEQREHPLASRDPQTQKLLVGAAVTTHHRDHKRVDRLVSAGGRLTRPSLVSADRADSSPVSSTSPGSVALKVAIRPRGPLRMSTASSRPNASPAPRVAAVVTPVRFVTHSTIPA